MPTPRPPEPPVSVPVSPGEPPEAAQAARELPGGAGRALAGALADAREWTARGPAGRAPLLRPAPAGLERAAPELALSLPALARLVREPLPDAATSEAVGMACFHLAEWAETRGALGTALAWAQCAIAAWPQHPHYAYAVGRIARKRAEYEHAEAWLRYALRLARRRAAWEVYALALGGVANLKRQRGNLPAALRYHRLSLKAARRFGLGTVQGDALYDLAVISFEMGDLAHGFSYARQAVAAYGHGHSRVFRLASDVAWCLMCHFGDFTRAAILFDTILPHVWDSPWRLLGAANLARAAGGAGWVEAFERAWVETWVQMRATDSREGHASALVQLSHGAASLRCWERARLAAESALRIAEERREGKVMAMAESILDALRSEVLAEEDLATTFPDLSRRRAGPDLARREDADDFTGEVVMATRVRRDGGPESPLRTSFGL